VNWALTRYCPSVNKLVKEGRRSRNYAPGTFRGGPWKSVFLECARIEMHFLNIQFALDLAQNGIADHILIT